MVSAEASSSVRVDRLWTLSPLNTVVLNGYESVAYLAATGSSELSSALPPSSCSSSACRLYSLPRLLVPVQTLKCKNRGRSGGGRQLERVLVFCVA